MLIGIPPKYSISEIVGCLKGKSFFIIFDRYANLKHKYGNRMFWYRGYYADTVGNNIKKYVIISESNTVWQIKSISVSNPFTVEKVKRNKNSYQKGS